MGDYFSQVYVKHFIWTQLQALVVFIFLTACLIKGCDLAWQFVYWIPVFFLYMMTQFVFFWEPKKNMTSEFNKLNCCTFIICLPLFFFFYFSEFYPTSSISFEKVEKCVVTGLQKTSLDGNEAYSLIYVNYVQNGDSYLGQGCLSNKYQGEYGNNVSPNDFYHKNETFNCGPGIVDYPKGNPHNNTNITEHSQRFRILRTGGRSSGGHSSGSHSSGSHSSGSHSSRSSSTSHSYSSSYGNRYHPYPYYGAHTSDSCKQSYQFSQAKIPSWFCGSDVYDLKNLLTPQTCYVYYYNQDSQMAQQNAKKRLNQRDLSEFAIISFNYPTYYPKKPFIYLILLCYYPMILSLNSIFQYTSNLIVKNLYKEDNEAETNQYDNKNGDQLNKNSLEMHIMRDSYN